MAGMGMRGARGRPRVLVIEDDESTADMLRMIVADLGCEVLIARDLGDADATHAPDLVISDLVVPRPVRGSAGRAYTEELRRRFGAVPILLLTAHSWIAHEGPDLSVDALLLKPFDVAALSDQVIALLRTPSSPRVSPAPSLGRRTPRSS
jgi:DNA-binding response OmpR family regulator